MSNPARPVELVRLTEPPRVCSYLPDQVASLEYRVFQGLSPEQLEHLIQRGWRRFGVEVFRPACAACTQCVPIRIDVQELVVTKSQRRAVRKNEDVQVTLHPASVSAEHIELYNAWHADMTQRRNWPPQQQTLESYARGFLAGDFPSLHELRYRRDGQLIGVGLIDLLPGALSSIYFYHAPAWRDLSPGTFSLLCEVSLARQLKREYVYLGYWIAGCPSMAYKNRFRPHQILLSRPADGQEADWLKVDPEIS